MVIPLSIALGLRYGTVSSDVDNSNEYTLTDKVILTYSSVFCQSLQAQSMDWDDTSNATLYVLDSYPPLSDIERFNMSTSASLSTEGDHEYWSFYLNEGSSVSLNVCYTSDTSFYDADFYLIRGDRNFNRWQDNEADSYYSIIDRSLLSQCQTIQYSLSNSDRFYFVFYSGNYYNMDLDINFQFNRTVYHVTPSNIIDNCSITLDVLSTCSVDVPLSSSYTALLSLNTSLPVDYTSEADIYVTCQPRIWLYAVIAVCACIAVVATLTCIIVCVCVLVKKGKKKYAPLVGNDPTAVREAYEESANVVPAPVNAPPGGTVGNPPPYNPKYSPAAAGGGYGAVAAAPGSTQYVHVVTQ